MFLSTGNRNRRACYRKRELSEPTFRESWRSSSRNVFGSRWPYSGPTATFQPALPRAGREKGRCFRVSGAPARLGSSGVLSLHNFNLPGERLIRLSKAMMCDTDCWKPPSWSAHNPRVWLAGGSNRCSMQQPIRRDGGAAVRCSVTEEKTEYTGDSVAVSGGWLSGYHLEGTWRVIVRWPTELDTSRSNE